MLARIMKKEAGDGSGLIYGMGHAVYTLSDPRAVILKRSAKKLAFDHGFEKEFMTLDAIERLTPQVFAEIKGVEKTMWMISQLLRERNSWLSLWTCKKLLCR